MAQTYLPVDLIADCCALRYDQAFDRNQRSRSGLAQIERIKNMQWGRILHFVRFLWEGADVGSAQYQLDIAVVQPWKAVSWLEGVGPADFVEPPWKLVQAAAQEQVISLADVVFFRGFTTQRTVQRDAEGKPQYAIMAVDLSLVLPHGYRLNVGSLSIALASSDIPLSISVRVASTCHGNVALTAHSDGVIYIYPLRRSTAEGLEVNEEA